MNIFKHLIFKRRARKLRTMIRRIDVSMKYSGWTRAKRRQFWHDFIRDQNVRDDLADFVGEVESKTRGGKR